MKTREWEDGRLYCVFNVYTIIEKNRSTGLEIDKKGRENTSICRIQCHPYLGFPHRGTQQYEFKQGAEVPYRKSSSLVRTVLYVQQLTNV